MYKIVNNIMNFFTFNKIKVKQRSIGIAICYFVLFLVYIEKAVFPNDPKYFYYFAVACLMFGGLIFFTNVKNSESIRPNWIIFIPWMAMGIVRFISGLNNLNTLSPDSVLMFIVFPILFYTINRYSFNKFIIVVMKVTTYLFGIFAIISIMFKPIIPNVRYQAVFTNSNFLGLYLIPVFACLLVLIITDEKEIVLTKFLNYLLVGVCLSFLFYTSCRTAQLACTGMFVVAIIMYAIKNKKFILKKILLIALATAIMIPLLINVMNFCDSFTIEKEVVQETTVIVSDDEVNTEEPSNDVEVSDEVPDINEPVTSTEIEVKEATDTIPNDQNTTIKDTFNKLLTRLDIRGKTLEQITSGRTIIWEAYVSELNWTGHKESLHFDTNGGFKYHPNSEVSDYDSVNGIVKYHAHNNLLQIAYNDGIPAGILWLIINVLSIILAIKLYLKSDNEISLIVLMIVVGFILASAFEMITDPIFYLVTLFYYLALSPIIVEVKTKNTMSVK